MNAMKVVYNISTPLALLFTIVGFIWCGHLVGSGLSTKLELDLHDLARHNRIEHDGSMGHADAAPGSEFAPSKPDKARIANMLAAGSARTSSNVKEPINALSILDFARVRYSLNLALRAPSNAIHAEIARGEAALTVLALGTRGDGGDIYDDEHEPVVPKDRIRQWFLEERLPANWSAPESQITIWKTMATSRRVKSDVARLAMYSQFH